MKSDETPKAHRDEQGEQGEGVRYISVWLMPDKEEAQVLKGIVDELASKFGTCSFEPHLTIVSSFYGVPQAVADAMDGIDSAKPNQGSFEFEVEGVEIGDRMTKTLYIKFKPNPEFGTYCRAFLTLPATQGNPTIPAPHLSLMYKEGGPAGLPEEKRAELASEAERISGRLKRELPVIRFNRVALVTSDHTLTTDTDVLKYRTVDEYGL